MGTTANCDSRTGCKRKRTLFDEIREAILLHGEWIVVDLHKMCHRQLKESIELARVLSQNVHHGFLDGRDPSILRVSKVGLDQPLALAVQLPFIQGARRRHGIKQMSPRSIMQSHATSQKEYEALCKQRTTSERIDRCKNLSLT